MFSLKRACIALAGIALAACGDDRSVNPIAEFVDGSSAAITTGGTLVAQYSLQVGQSVTIKPKSTTRTNRLKWSSSNSTVASVNSTGTVTAKTSGSATVQVSGTGVLENYAITVTAPAAPKVTSFSLQPKTGVSLTSGQSQQFAASATWSDGMQYPITVSYTATGGTISGTGLFTAGNMAGTFMVVATCACTSPAIADTAFVNITAPQLTKLTISPKTVSLAAGASQQFGVTASWSTGATTVPPVTWTASAGTVSSTGAYVAPSVAGTYQVIVAHTNGTVRDTAVVTVASTVTTQPSNGWSTVRNFNSGTVGTRAQRTFDGFDDAAGNSLYTAERSAEGGMAAKLSIDSGTTAFGNWGGVINFPRPLVQGESLWLQLYVLIPQDFVISTPGNGSLKFLRIRTKTATGGNGGFNDIQLMDDLNQNNSFRMIKEGQFIWYRFGAPGSFTKGAWQRVTVQLVFHSVPMASGGAARVRIWQNGQLLTDESRMQTLSGADNVADSFYLFTYWNGSAPKTQSLFVDDIRMSTTQPTWASDLQGVTPL